jgi:hypothetical protein
MGDSPGEILVRGVGMYCGEKGLGVEGLGGYENGRLCAAISVHRDSETKQTLIVLVSMSKSLDLTEPS